MINTLLTQLRSQVKNLLIDHPSDIELGSYLSCGVCSAADLLYIPDTEVHAGQQNEDTSQEISLGVISYNPEKHQ